MIQGRGPSPFYVLELVQGLPDDSLTYALARGGRQYLGWGEDRLLAAKTHDAIFQLIRTSGNWKKGSVPKFDPWPTPFDAKPVVDENVSPLKRIFNKLNRR